tara:strand:- start:168 stop:419 length:252 start_codon:yes stop_codon:yes gene_type:complete
MKKGVNMTFQELVNMTRQEQLAVWIDAGESGDTELEELTMSAMAATQGVDRMSSGRAPQLTPRVIDETEAQRSERLNMLRRHG